ncbi:MAG: RNA polymerase recycling motor HelD [Sarcina sp.]
MDTNILENERKNLKDTKVWLDLEIERIKNEENEMKERVSVLEKKSKGSYNQELDINKRLYNILKKNMTSYEEAKEKPYFAKIDFREFRKDPESFYIGKTGLGDMVNGEEKVIDWRAPIADLYYSGTQGDAYYVAPSGVIEGELKVKRKFLFNKNNDIEKCFDEGINEIILKVQDDEENALIDEFLKVNLEESTGNKLKEVVATIQKEQNDIIRADKSFPMIIQGSAGSGKTTVALHRLAYLMYRHKETLSGDDILVVAPNKIFLDYISEVLPNLGVDKVPQMTFEELAIKRLSLKGSLISKDKKLVRIIEDSQDSDMKYIKNESRLKGTLGFKSILDRYIRVLERNDSQIDDIKVDKYSLFDNKEIKRLFLKDLVNYPLNKRKDEIKRYFEKKLGQKILDVLNKVDFQYDYTISRTKKVIEDEVERRREVIKLYDERDNKKVEIKKEAKSVFNKYFESWKGISTKNIYSELFANDEILQEVTSGKIPPKLVAYIKENLKNNIESNLIDADDLAAMLYLEFKIAGLSEEDMFKHIVVDEAQDYSPLQLEVISMMSRGRSLTIVGDIGQGIYSYKGINSWDTIVENLYKEKGIYKTLTQSYRSTVEIINFANKVLRKQENYPKPAMPVLRHGMEPVVKEFKLVKDFASEVDIIVKKVRDEGKKSVAIVCKTLKECKRLRDNLKKYSENNFVMVKNDDKTLELDLIIIPSYLTKGLEFDCTIVYNLSEENYSNNELDKKLLYVVLTRALHYEYAFYKGELSSLISEEENV